MSCPLDIQARSHSEKELRKVELIHVLIKKILTLVPNTTMTDSDSGAALQMPVLVAEAQAGAQDAPS